MMTIPVAKTKQGMESFRRKTAPSWKWPGIPRWGLALPACATAFGLLEAGIRLQLALHSRRYQAEVIQFVEDPALRYTLKPGVRLGETYVNELGFIGKAPSPSKREKTRVIAIGDSVTAQTRMKDQSWPEVLERLLIPDAKVYIMAAPGYNAIQEAAVAELSLHYSPDVIIIAYVLNDPYPDLAIIDHVVGPLKSVSLVRSYLESLDRYKALGRPNSIEDAVVSLHRGPDYKKIVLPSLDRLSRITLEHDRRVIVGIVPLLTDFDKPRLLDIYEQVAADASLRGLEVIRLDRVFADTGQPEVFLKTETPNDIIHPNEKGHELIATAMADKIRSNPSLPLPSTGDHPGTPPNRHHAPGGSLP